MFVNGFNCELNEIIIFTDPSEGRQSEVTDRNTTGEQSSNTESHPLQIHFRSDSSSGDSGSIRGNIFIRFIFPLLTFFS